MRVWKGIAAAVGMFILIMDGETAVAGAAEGLDLCIRTVIPSLFPFFLLSILLTSSFSGSGLPVLRPLGRLCRIPNGAEAVLLSGFLGGYPVGAQCVASAYQSGGLSQRDACRMLAFCNNAGPAFLFGMISSIFPSKWYAFSLWGIHIASAILVAVLLPGGKATKVSSIAASDLSVPAALQAALRVMGTVCGWVILFRVCIAFGNRWLLWRLSTEARVLITGLLELSNGCWALSSIDDLQLRFVICSGILAFGGLCVTMQTISVTKGLPLSLYIRGKLMQTFFSVVLSWSLVTRNWWLCLLFLLTSMPLLRKSLKNSSNSIPFGV